MWKAELFLNNWKSLEHNERCALANRVAAATKDRFRFTGLQRFSLGDQEHEIARFQCDGALYSLIPGGESVLGYDPRHRSHPSKECLVSWRETVEEYGLEIELDEYIESVTSPLRTVRIEPFLLEVHSWEAGVEPMPSLGHSTEGGRGAYRVELQSQQQVSQQLAEAGFRLPSPDEWEYACRGGSKTLFRWGDHCPGDSYPVDDGSWDLHRRPNAYALHIAQDPYKWEFTDDPGVLRGGDGGAEICGGAGFYVAWLTLASAYVDHSSGKHYKGREVPLAHVRRAYTLPQ